jgi:flavin reductase (DIM6/NTAB) family NADH-FMN oxidoreductase RutF
MEKIKITPEKGKKYFYNYPSNVVVVGVQDNERRNVMPVAWSTTLSYDPFLYGVSIGVNRHSHSLLSKTDAFTVNFMDFKDSRTVRSLGRSSGAEMDKIAEFKLPVHAGEKVPSPVLDNAYCTFECVKKDQLLLGDHTLFVGEVVLMHVAENAATLENALNTEEISPLLYLGADSYITSNPKSRISLKDLPFYYKRKDPFK